MKYVFITALFFIYLPAYSASKKLYIKKDYAHIHQNPSKFSDSITTAECGLRVKVLKSTSEQWTKAQLGPHRGYIMSKHLASQRPRCSFDRYPKFFEELKLGIGEMFYWGRLSDLFVEGKTRPR